MRASSHKRDENNGSNDRDDNRTDAAETIGKEREHTALPHIDQIRGLFLSRFSPGT
jgi:hypothetical protein